MPALILPLKKHTVWWSPAYIRISNGWQFIVNITNVHLHPFPPSSKLNLTTWRQFDLIATASSSADWTANPHHLNVQLLGQRVWRACFCVATCIFRSCANIWAPTAGMDLTPSSPGAACSYFQRRGYSSQPLASSYFSADQHLHENDRWLRPSSG